MAGHDSATHPESDSGSVGVAPLTDEALEYWAFISYSHQDAAWGDWLHKALETYRIPKVLRGRSKLIGDWLSSIPARVMPIFRDREELPTSSDLSTQIAEALEKSRTLIVICSPHAAKSHWVNQEILTFRRLGRGHRILAIIVDGEPNATDKDGFDSDLECFPQALRYALPEEEPAESSVIDGGTGAAPGAAPSIENSSPTEIEDDGAILPTDEFGDAFPDRDLDLENTLYVHDIENAFMEGDKEADQPLGKRIEPIAADVRPGKDTREDAKLKLVAGILGIRFDGLKRRDLQRKVQRMVRMSVAAVVLVVVMAGLAFLALQSRNEASHQRSIAESAKQKTEVIARQSRDRLTRDYVLSGWDAYDQGDLPLALLWQVEAFRLYDELPDPEESHPEASSRHHLRIANVREDMAIPEAILFNEADLEAPTPHLSDRRLRFVPKVRYLAFGPREHRLIILREGQPVRQWNFGTDSLEFEYQQKIAPIQHALVSPDGSRLVTADDLGHLFLWNTLNGKLVTEAFFPGKIQEGGVQ